MAPTTIEELFLQLMDGTTKPNIMDHFFVQLLTEPGKKETRKLLEKNPDMEELQRLLHESLRGEEPGRTNAGAALLAIRAIVAAEGEHDTAAAVEQSRIVVKRLDGAHYPVNYAQTHLKLGTALAALSSVKGDHELEVLQEAIESLNQAVKLLDAGESPELVCLAHYNLAIAHSTLWRSQADWDDEGPDNKEAALRQGTAAIALMKAGARSGNRLMLTQTLLDIALAEGDLALQNEKARKLVIDLLEWLLESPEVKKGGREAKKRVRDLLDRAKGQG